MPSNTQNSHEKERGEGVWGGALAIIAVNRLLSSSFFSWNRGGGRGGRKKEDLVVRSGRDLFSRMTISRTQGGRMDRQLFLFILPLLSSSLPVLLFLTSGYRCAPRPIVCIVFFYTGTTKPTNSHISNLFLCQTCTKGLLVDRVGGFQRWLGNRNVGEKVGRE